MLIFLKISLFLLLSLSTLNYSHAQNIELSDEELETETVLPRFDKTVVVKNRYVTTKGRFELSLGMGFNLTEPLYENKSFHLGGGYNFTETHGFQFHFMSIFEGLSTNGEALRAGQGLLNDESLDALLAPHPKQMILLDYQFTAWYGKISVTKNTIVNLSLYGLLGIGAINFTDSNTVGLNIGFGQKYYITKNIALKTDLRFHIYEGPNPADAENTLRTGTDPVPSDKLEKVLYTPTILNVGLMAIF